jgi:hypothetical protein
MTQPILNWHPTQGYETWVFVGSNLGLAYKSEVSAMTARESERAEQQAFHNVFMDSASFAKFIETGTFPDPTILMMELYLAENKDPGGVLSQGVFNGRRILVEAAVKDSKRPTHKGSESIWAYYAFPLDGRRETIASGSRLRRQGLRPMPQAPRKS